MQCRTPAPPGITETLDAFIRHEMGEKAIPALSIVLVDDQDLVLSAGYGTAQPATETMATGATVYRVASLSKLFTAMAVMQLVERGELDLDAPVTDYVPAFAPENPFGTPVTLRQIHSHRSGIVREPPVGHYFDPDAPSIAETVASLNRTALVYPPETQTKYSNAAVTVAGYAVEQLKGEAFSDYVERALLHPMGMMASSFSPRPDLRERLAEGYMWTYDGRQFPAPVFELGMVPAANLYTTMEDLGRVLSVLFNDGRARDGTQVLSPAALAQMWEIQYATPGQETGYGLGFFVNRFQGERRVQHSGVMYGYATRIAALPDRKLGVAVVGTIDAANSTVDRIAEYALSLLMARQDRRPLPALEPFAPVDPAQARALDGRYASDDTVYELIERDGDLYLFNGEERHRLARKGDSLVTYDRLANGYTLLPTDDGVLVDAARRRFARVERPRPAPPAAHHTGLIGEYGWDHNTLYVLEREGRLWALIEWFFYYPLEELDADTYRMPGYGLYPDETLTFTRGPGGRATNASLVGVDFARRRLDGEDGSTFRIDPVRPVAALRVEAETASPPPQPEGLRAPGLVDVTTIDVTLRLDIRYATTNNFMGAVFYEAPRAFLQRPAADALARAAASLRAHGLGIVVYDAYRPWSVTRMFWDATPEHQKEFVANPANGSRHNRGAAVDIGLYDLETGDLVAMPSGYDEFSPRAYPDYPGGSSRSRWHREILRDAMEDAGFTVYAREWWHFDYADWASYPVMNIPFAAVP